MSKESLGENSEISFNGDKNVQLQDIYEVLPDDFKAWLYYYFSAYFMDYILKNIIELCDINCSEDMISTLKNLRPYLDSLRLQKVTLLTLAIMEFANSQKPRKDNLGIKG